LFEVAIWAETQHFKLTESKQPLRKEAIYKHIVESIDDNVLAFIQLKQFLVVSSVVHCYDEHANAECRQDNEKDGEERNQIFERLHQQEDVEGCARRDRHPVQELKHQAKSANRRPNHRNTDLVWIH